LIRPARVDDAEAIARLHVRSWQAAYRGIVSDEFLDSMSVDQMASRWRQRLEEAATPTLVTERGGEVVGFAHVGPSRDDPDSGRGGELYAIYLEPSAWGLGLGRDLLAASRQKLAELGFQAAMLWVLRDNERARRFYFADGWRLDGAEKPISIGGSELVEVRYQRSIQAT